MDGVEIRVKLSAENATYVHGLSVSASSNQWSEVINEIIKQVRMENESIDTRKIGRAHENKIFHA